MLDALYTNPTQLTGLVAFATSALACMRAARVRRSLWPGLAAAQWAGFAEIVFSTRFLVHDAVDAALQAHGVYAQRTPWQIALLVLTGALAALCLRAALRWRHRDRAAAWALAATVVVFILFVAESVSLHDVDALMYRHVGPILAIAWGWVAAAAAVVVSAVVASRGVRH